MPLRRGERPLRRDARSKLLILVQFLGLGQPLLLGALLLRHGLRDRGTRMGLVGGKSTDVLLGTLLRVRRLRVGVRLGRLDLSASESTLGEGTTGKGVGRALPEG